MGWLWSSSSEDDAAKRAHDNSSTQPSKNLDFGLTEEQRSRIFGKNVSLQSANKTRDEQEDRDLEEFMTALRESDSSDRNAASESPPEQLAKHDRIRPDGSLNISPEATYPRKMSCRQAFDQAFYCQSLGGKFNDIYRYGHLQSCSEQWGAFWFCMRVRTLSTKERERQTRDYYAERDTRKRKEFGSSEAVWEIRDKPVQKAFWKDPDVDPDGDDMQLKE